MTATLPVSQNKRRALYRNLTVAVIGLLAVLAVLSRVFDVTVHMPATALALSALALCILQFNTLDEVAKQAHYVAWYWGGLVALVAMAVLSIAITASPQVFAAIEGLMLQWFGKADPQTSFMLGLIATPSLLVLGFAGWWSIYWLRRR